MIEQRIKELLSIEYEKQVLIHDLYSFSTTFDYEHLLSELGYEIIKYEDVEQFRFIYESELKKKDKKTAVIVSDYLYIPYDIRRAFYEVSLSLGTIYPKLCVEEISKYVYDLPLIDFAYDTLYEEAKEPIKTKRFIELIAFSAKNILEYIETVDKQLISDSHKAIVYSDWISIAKRNARNEFYAAKIGLIRKQEEINNEFEKFIFEGYQKLSGIVSKDAPTILPKTIDLVAGDKVALVVIDGMSLFDFEIISRYMTGFSYDYHCSFALIPTTTSISRQSLLSGKYPQQLERPFSLAKEEAEFYGAAFEHGYTKKQSFYGRGYDAVPGHMARFAAIIVNDIDDMVHGQMQGRQGMFNDVSLLAKTGKIQHLCEMLINNGFTVYLTADHGNTHCVGGGAAKRTGVETETKSKRMIILKDFADITPELAERIVQYPGYYMDKTYQYLICKGDTSFNNIGEDVMTHGGITIEEVIVPFIKIRRDKKNG